MDHTDTDVPRLLPVASVADTVRAGVRVLLPLLARGLILRRPPVVALAERAEVDRRAVRELQRLRHRYGSGPLLLQLPLRRMALVLDGDDVHRVLMAPPEVFSPANLEKRHALGHFQPRGVLVSEGARRADRRRFNEEVLDTRSPVHRQGATMVGVVGEEASSILTAAERSGELTWDGFIAGWFRMVRRVTFGDGAADDHHLTDMSAALRARANWAFLRPTDRDLRERFLERIHHHVGRAEPGSLAADMAGAHTSAVTEPEQQVPQWLFAFDPAGIATFRALALLAAHPDHERRVREELDRVGPGSPSELPLLRATVLESLRLWPTTPGILRDSVVATRWHRGTLPARSALLIFAPLFHRDDRALAEADTFAPELWSHRRTTDEWPLVPFSEGPAVCPGQNLVLLLTTAMLASLLDGHEYRLRDPQRVDRSRPMPSVLSPFDLAFEIHAPTATARS